MSDRETRLREIRERVEKATPGPWIGTGGSFGVTDEDGDTELCLGDVYERSDESFIANAREDVPWLLTEVDRLERRWDLALAGELAGTRDLENRLGKMGYFPPDPSGEGYVSGLVQSELGLFAVRELESERNRVNNFADHAKELNAEIERLQRELRSEQRRADELDGIGRDMRRVLDEYESLVRIDRDERTEEQTERLRELAIVLRGHSEEDQLRAEVLRLREELDGVKCELELRKTLHVQPEESEHIARTSSLLIRVLAENDELRAEVERLNDGELLRVSKQLDTGTAAFDYPGSAVDG